jgi:hypothetical protein
MRKALTLVFACALFAAGRASVAQQPSSSQAHAPAQPPAQAPQPAARPLDLNLRLNDLDRPPAVTFAPQEKKKQDAVQGLPQLGGKPSRTLDQPPPDVVPPSNPNIE